ncbi:WD repeat-containing protein 25 [Amborella trichopoda]|uniref:Uncharacterized protein n=1 Tax=Amborella trichopoda TaxID=13333 RepID=W1PX59_AMBTC|nr:WD repeat-containing protein 25 [Amborella trichopoda]ERN12788.1 hypothetical protein AMTR_s00043p00210250 [Amborella trichopoda]|eukprot:XP_006851207.1 WD repeat-containing protein 25 [Amborella trichopoda]
MDLLRKTYTADSDDEGDDRKFLNSTAKRLRPSSNSQYYHTAIPPLPAHPPDYPSRRSDEASVPGRYVSKRERLIPTPPSRVSDTTVSSTGHTSPGVGSISDADLPYDVLASLRRQTKAWTKSSKTPESLSIKLSGHTNAVNAIHWSPTHAHLLASAGMDQNVYVWNVWSCGQKRARVFHHHNAVVKDVQWSKQGLSLLTCGYDCSSRLIDVEKGSETMVFKEDQMVRVIKFHPNNPNLFLSGGSKGSLKLWDLRTSDIVQQYVRGLGPILDFDFSIDAKHFISSCDVSGGNVSENSIIVWDLRRLVPLSNQVYVEAYTCPCIRYHPFDSCFVAQSNGNYIAIFSANSPFKLDRYKRYEKHGVSGFPIRCGFSLDGELLVTGSAEGCIYFYSYKSSKLVKKLKAYELACIDVAFHPLLPNVFASCSWSGDVSVFE